MASGLMKAHTLRTAEMNGVGMWLRRSDFDYDRSPGALRVCCCEVKVRAVG